MNFDVDIDGVVAAGSSAKDEEGKRLDMEAEAASSSQNQPDKLVVDKVEHDQTQPEFMDKKDMSLLVDNAEAHPDDLSTDACHPKQIPCEDNSVAASCDSEEVVAKDAGSANSVVARESFEDAAEPAKHDGCHDVEAAGIDYAEPNVSTRRSLSKSDTAGDQTQLDAQLLDDKQENASSVKVTHFCIYFRSDL